MQSKAKTVAAYLSELPEDRRAALSAVRKVFLDNLDDAFEVGMSYGMISYYIPHRLYPAGYHCDPSKPLPFAGLASQKGKAKPAAKAPAKAKPTKQAAVKPAKKAAKPKRPAR